MKPNSLIENFYKKVLQTNSSNGSSSTATTNNNGTSSSKLVNDELDDDDSSDDDFVIDESGDDDDDNSETSEDDDNNEEDDDDEEEESSNDDESHKNVINSKQIKTNTTHNNINSAIKPKLKPNLDKKICCVCLNEQSESSDELVQCDSCGFYTHEGCYGITEADSRHSSDSVESTEPWFCNACLSNVNKPKCDLCPNDERSGLFKETQSGRFVHIVCALYSPEVSFEDTDKLWPVVLNEIPAKKWGDRVCSLCDNLYVSRSGICIKCDAGLCKTYFHVTCAMKHGLLVDPSQQNANDPFFAYCKQHNDSDQIRQRKLKYIQMVEANKQLNLTLNERIKLKFKHAQIDYNLKRKQAHLPRQETHKIPRLLTTNPSSLTQLMQKSHLNNSSQKHTVQKHSANQVTFTSEFVKYYYDRELKLEQLCQEIPQMKKLQTDLTIQEKELRLSYEAKLREKNKLVSEFAQQSKLFDACINMFVEQKKLKNKLKDLLDVKQVQIESDESLNVSSLNNSEASSRLELDSQRKGYRKRKPQFESQISLDAECFICKQKTNSHLLVECDTCKTYYHINCLEPPLSAVPKKTKLYGWECAKCVRKKDSDYEDEEAKKEVEEENEKRSLRRERKQTRSNLQETLEMEHLLKLVKKREKPKNEKRGRKKKLIVDEINASNESTSRTKKQEIPKKEPKKRRPYTKRKKLETNNNNNNADNVSGESTVNTTKNENEIESLIDSVVQESIIINTSSDECNESADISEIETVKKKLKV